MPTKAQSLQEQLLTPITQFSWAAPFVFAPDEWRCGSGTREPADLVWACNNCVILIHMAEGKRHDALGKRSRVREKLIKHNLKQLAGWMRHWRLGHPLTGSNNHSSYSIQYNDSLNVVALSVIDCDDAEARFHEDVAHKLRIVLSATLPQSLFVGLATIMGSTLDLMFMLESLKERGRPASEEDGLAWLRAYRMDAVELSGAARFWPGGVLDARFWEIAQHIIASRSPAAHPGGLSSHFEPETFGIYNDLMLLETYDMIARLREMVDQLRQEPNRIIIAERNMAHYAYSLCVVPSLGIAGIPEKLTPVIAGWSQRQASGELRSGPKIILDAQTGDCLTPLAPRTGVRQLESLLNKMRSATS
jgi:hypothetical protein